VEGARPPEVSQATAVVHEMEIDTAREKLSQARKRAEIGLVTPLDVAEAEYQVTLAEAALAGDRLAGPQARVRLAKERLNFAMLRYEYGTCTLDELAEAKLELARAESDLQQLVPTDD